MPSQSPSFFTRLALAFAVLGNGKLAAQLQDVRDGVLPAAPPPPPAPVAPPAPAPVLKVATPDAALQLLALLQREARFVDFLQEDVAGYPDADIGGAARLVHAGCRKVLDAHFTLAPARPEAEGSRIVLEAGFDAASVRLTGNVVGQAPFRGTLRHPGWKATDVRLPRTTEGHDPRILAAAEVEL
ncbi:hypothetical protein J2X19_004567 [Rhodoferax ferrireducens]|uniref:DUF2760 domain-containing protein n=1 Tax=Rhodoferax ferrireducens TaxID=192843 RepID=A0ABU2CEX9_9BURK|nr:DUF2760 domain-containing protein [Rhodoferax ferrireducens]MDR7379871.1 hypothetical protein [Rhodoferax ferrireducens]